MWVPPMPSLATVQSGAGAVRSCAAEINNPRLLRATILTAAVVFSVLTTLAFLSCWAGKRGAAGRGSAARPAARPTTLLTMAGEELTKAERETDPVERQNLATRGLALVQTAEATGAPSEGVDVPKMRRVLQALAINIVHPSQI